jgi:hypothetical protein
LGLVDETEIPASCKSAFDVACFRMEERLSYSNTEKVYYTAAKVLLMLHECEEFTY